MGGGRRVSVVCRGQEFDLTWKVSSHIVMHNIPFRQGCSFVKKKYGGAKKG